MCGVFPASSRGSVFPLWGMNTIGTLSLEDLQGHPAPSLPGLTGPQWLAWYLCPPLVPFVAVRNTLGKSL